MISVVGPQSIKTSDKVKRLVVHMVKWWRDQASDRVRSSQLGIAPAAIDAFVREVCTSKKLLVVLGTSVFPYMSRTTVDASLIADILRVKVCDMMVLLGVGEERKSPELPVKLSYAETGDGKPEDVASNIDWSDVDFDAEEPEAQVGRAEIVFAGNRYLRRWKTSLKGFYVENSGRKNEGTADARTTELVRILREVEAAHVHAQG